MFENADLITAIITPFDEKLHINFDALAKLTDHLLDTGSTGFVIGGTTGETPTLTHDEKIELYQRFASIVNGRVPIIAGTGSNNTLETIKFTNEVAQIKGINAALVVVPYYNKPNQRGMIAHFKEIASHCDIPIFIYNIPGRVGVQMDNQTILQLSKVPNIIGIKQCTNLEDLSFLIENTPSNFAIYTGNDVETLGALALGAQGVISVASHVYGKQIRKLINSLRQGDITLAGNLQRWLEPKMNALFMYPSPSPVKAILNAQGFNVGSTRLPILPLNQGEIEQLTQRLAVEKLSSIALNQTDQERN